MNTLLSKAKKTGETLEMIYMSDKQQISQRKVKVLEVQGDTIKAYCFLRRMPRVFKLNNILSIGPIRNRRGA